MIAPTPATTSAKGPMNSAIAAAQRSRSSTDPLHTRPQHPGGRRPLQAPPTTPCAGLYGRLRTMATGADWPKSRYLASLKAPPLELHGHRLELVVPPTTRLAAA